MLPFSAITGEDCGFGIHLPVVFPSILHHHHPQLIGGICHTLYAEVKFQRHLLMTYVGVYVGVARDAHGKRHRLFRDTEVDVHHFAIIVFVIVNMNAVIAAQPEAHTVVGYLELVMGIGHGGVHRGVVIVDGVAVESFQPVAFE